MDFNGNQMVQGPNESFSAASKGFKRHQTMNKGLRFNHLKAFEQFAVCTESVFWTLNRLVPIEVHYVEKILECFHQKPSFLFNGRKKVMDILDDMGVSKLSAKVFFKSELLL